MRQRDLKFTFSVVAAQVEFEVVEFTLEEGVCLPYRLTLELASDTPDIDFAHVLDQPAVLTIWQGGTAVRYVHGLVSSFTQGTTGFRRTRYRALVEPPFARLGLSGDWRIFQHKSVPEILKSVLDEHGVLDYQQRIYTEHLPREYCAQVGDSDLYLFERLSTEEGLFYFFKHEARTCTLIQSDKLYVQERIEGDPVLFSGQPAGDAEQPVLYAFSYTENVRTAQQTQRDYSFKRPAFNQQQHGLGDDLEHQAQHYERYDYPGRYKVSAAGKPFTRNRLLGLRGDARVATVQGDDPRLIPGFSFQLTGHPRADFNRWWRTLRVTHKGIQHASQQEESAGAEVGVSYDFTAQIVTEDTEWRPQPLPKPVVDGPQIATVVGPEGEEIHVDEFGRVKIQYPWDRKGRHDAFSSCWVRVSQNWAGAEWGHMAIPRIGQEVIVDYLDGDCDQPIITGRTYRASHMPPYQLPNHKTLSTIKSKEYKGARANELRIDDTTQQISAALMSDHGSSALHLGYLTHPRPAGGAARGEGFELRTDQRGALRAAKGLLLSTEEQLKADGGQLNRVSVVQVLEAALQLAKGLGEYAAGHAGVAHDSAPQETLSEAVRALGQGANDEPGGNGGKPAIALSGPAGIAAASPQSITLAAGEHIDSVAQQNQQLTSGQKIVLNAGSDLGLFAQGGEIRQIAHQGLMLLQAQNNTIRLEADQSVEVSASKQHVLISAKEHITLMCGGAYLTLKGGNIELGMPGNFTVKAARHSHTGPAHASTSFNSWDSTPFNDAYVLRDETTLQPLANTLVELQRGDGATIKLSTDSQGRLPKQQDLAMDQVQIRILADGNGDKESSA
ncbi:type VI secretion system secreted protein VgrG [Pseudomonas sp. NFPP10]|uniref:type VI secretion system Vgr family protein n=1 Tax=Pseudomonas TaxID=286 RepID=UPI00088A8636|nr:MULTISPECIES: type VI secretion system tip protein VgrG [Pseudomonas]PZP10431.1 MAG: type VI secretion system tip protein VgrG [Pseudomonas protegens]QTU07074.1 type VI secretion system tip protein VgrG [Pseudomonas protegens]QTU13384.1 type VI secretion system tip protein VgrG [Pseudomonas protegens]QTU39237.1 type VI secretion system tip protein VgrG [Pseudomonas protegens]ROM13311.1 type IV secretion protein Rhs [Pseudomonas protegens]